MDMISLSETLSPGAQLAHSTRLYSATFSGWSDRRDSFVANCSTSLCKAFAFCCDFVHKNGFVGTCIETPTAGIVAFEAPSRVIHGGRAGPQSRSAICEGKLFALAHGDFWHLSSEVLTLRNPLRCKQVWHLRAQWAPAVTLLGTFSDSDFEITSHNSKRLRHHDWPARYTADPGTIDPVFSRF